MLKVGKINTLTIVKSLDFGVYLDGEDKGEILMPRRYVPEDAKVGDSIDAFIYLDSEDRLIATTETPLTQVGQFACLKVKQVNKAGAFMEWGLPKDLFLPFGEQQRRVFEDDNVVVFTYIDADTGRIACSSKLGQFLKKESPEFKENDAVEIIIVERTNLGYKAIINSSYWGLLYENQIFEQINIGEKKKAYIHTIRPDGKIDLILQKPGYEKVSDISEQIFEKIKEEGGFIAITDHSDSEIIYDTFGISKKTFKKAIGNLYKNRKIILEDNGIRIATKHN